MNAEEILQLAEKICTGCGRKYPATAEHFYRKSSVKDGLQHRCKKCAKLYSMEYFKTSIGRDIIRRYQRTSRYRRYRGRYTNSVKGHLRDVFANMKRRCINPECRAYKWYGGRGIKCLFTSNEFVSYVMDELKVDPRRLECDRIDNDGNYERGNIRFVTHEVNMQNTGRQG